jgi:hypothetical protein
MGLSFTIVAGPRQNSHSQVESHETHNHRFKSLQILSVGKLKENIKIYFNNFKRMDEFRHNICEAITYTGVSELGLVSKGVFRTLKVF